MCFSVVIIWLTTMVLWQSKPFVLLRAVCCSSLSPNKIYNERHGWFFLKGLNWNLWCRGHIKLTGRQSAKKKKRVILQQQECLILLKHDLLSKWSLKYWVVLNQSLNCPQKILSEYLVYLCSLIRCLKVMHTSLLMLRLYLELWDQWAGLDRRKLL